MELVQQTSAGVRGMRKAEIIGWTLLITSLAVGIGMTIFARV
jgi:hypothetical protein